MNYGDGWYGGVYVAAMYSLSFVSDDIGFIVEEALKTIPEQSRYYRCMKDVIAWHKQYPGDWKRTWFECEKKWSSDIGCPDGVFVPFNIDAVINSAYILIGLLYGEGDFSKTLDIATRADRIRIATRHRPAVSWAQCSGTTTSRKNGCATCVKWKIWTLPIPTSRSTAPTK